MPPPLDSEQDEQHRTLLDVVVALYRQKRKIAVAFFVIMTLVSLFTFMPAPAYRSEANLLVRVGRDNVFLEAMTATGRVASVGQSRESELISELALLRSRDLAEQLVDALGPDGRSGNVDVGPEARRTGAAFRDERGRVATRPTKTLPSRSS